MRKGPKFNGKAVGAGGCCGWTMFRWGTRRSDFPLFWYEAFYSRSRPSFRRSLSTETLHVFSYDQDTNHREILSLTEQSQSLIICQDRFWFCSLKNVAIDDAWYPLHASQDIQSASACDHGSSPRLHWRLPIAARVAQYQSHCIRIVVRDGIKR